MNTVKTTSSATGDSPSQSFSLDELCALTDLSKRTVRYYVQLGLVSRPEGETRAAKYTPQHLEQLLLIKKWTAAGVSLDRIRELLQGGPAPVPDRGRRPGSLEVCSHLHITEGIELVIEPTRAGLSPEQLRSFVRSVMQAYEAVQAPQSPPNT
jgi:DNA-binding transcriptional MerR regulator